MASKVIVLNDMLIYVQHCLNNNKDITTGKLSRVKTASKALPENTVKLNEAIAICQTVSALDATMTEVVFARANLDRLPPRDDGDINIIILNMKLQQLSKRCDNILRAQITAGNITEQLVEKVEKIAVSRSEDQYVPMNRQYAEKLRTGLNLPHGLSNSIVNHAAAAKKDFIIMKRKPIATGEKEVHHLKV
ncbi:unnamed protein product [Orchesella dallaii]|uniref:Uncharacterized protein n=1 Tax=Orchesella dallaii TaxID=48710 RepID=A0ABP1RV32_9HEXA